jgi:hypothetical protein
MFTRILSCLILALPASVASAAPLSTLTTLRVGPLVFENFAYYSHGDMPAAADVDVSPFHQGNQWGLTIAGDFRDNPGAFGSNARIWYTVRPFNSVRQITGASLASDATAGPDSYVIITETLFPGVLALFDSQAESILNASIDFATPRDEFPVVTTISPYAYGGSPASVGVITQAFTTRNPEPATLGMAALACLAVLYTRRTSCVKKS